MQVLEQEQQRRRRGNDFEGLADLTQHPLARRAENLLLESFAKLRRQQRGELHEPRRRMRREDFDNTPAIGALAQRADGLEDRIEGLLAAKSFDALPARDAYVILGCADQPSELFHQSTLPDARLTSDENQLRLPAERFSQLFFEHTECELPTNEGAAGHSNVPRVNDRAFDRGKESIAPTRQRLDVARAALLPVCGLSTCGYVW